jgi:RND family efflux transporter MFP subunit
MKNYATLIIGSLVLFLVACGGDKNSVEAKKTALASLKKQALEISINIANLEKEIKTLGGAKADKTILVSIDTIKTQVFDHYIELQGKIESESVSYITPRAGGGQVRSLYVKRGDIVKKGQLLLQLDNSLIKQSAAAASQNIETLKAQAALAKSVYEKQKNLWEQNIGSEIQLLTAKTNAEALASQLKGATEQVGVIKDQLAYTSIYSDVDGVAEEVNIHVGEMFMGAGQIKIVNTQKLKATALVPENYTGKVHVGSDVALNFPDMQKTIETKISVMGKVIDPLSRSFFIETKLTPNSDFRPNQLVQVRIKDYSKSNALSIPINILQNDEKGKFIYVAVSENGKMIARKKMITVGEFYGDNMEVLSGLVIGDAIITTGYQNLFDGQFITTLAK